MKMRSTTGIWAMAILGLFFAGCISTSPEEIEVTREVPVTVIVEKEVVVEVPVVETVVVEKEVTREIPVTVIVEKEVVVEVPVVETVVVEKEVTREVPVTVIVEKEAVVEAPVVQTVVVEKEVVDEEVATITPTPMNTANTVARSPVPDWLWTDILTISTGLLAISEYWDSCEFKISELESFVERMEKFEIDMDDISKDAEDGYIDDYTVDELMNFTSDGFEILKDLESKCSN